MEFPDYQISSYGKIKRVIPDKWNHKLKMLKQRKNKNGYFYINLCKNKKQFTKYTHILLFETFNDYKLKKDECIHHKDENKENNYYENLIKMMKYDHEIFHNSNGKSPNTGKKFSIDHKSKISKTLKEKFKNGELNFKGINHPNCKLSKQDIYDIERSLNLKLYTPKQLSWMFDYNYKTILKIKSGKF